jgi:hypothetical protein
MVMSFVRIDLCYAQGEEGEWEELEGVFERGAISDYREKGVLLLGFFVGVGFEGAEGTLDCCERISNYA